MRAEPLLNHLTPGTPDTEWLPFLGERGWALLTTDAKIRFNLVERAAVREHRIRMFYFARNDIAGREMGEALRVALPEINRLWASQAPPFAASVTRVGNVTLRDLFPIP